MIPSCDARCFSASRSSEGIRVLSGTLGTGCWMLSRCRSGEVVVAPGLLSAMAPHWAGAQEALPLWAPFEPSPEVRRLISQSG